MKQSLLHPNSCNGLAISWWNYWLPGLVGIVPSYLVQFCRAAECCKVNYHGQDLLESPPVSPSRPGGCSSWGSENITILPQASGQETLCGGNNNNQSGQPTDLLSCLTERQIELRVQSWVAAPGGGVKGVDIALTFIVLWRLGKECVSDQPARITRPLVKNVKGREFKIVPKYLPQVGVAGHTFNQLFDNLVQNILKLHCILQYNFNVSLIKNIILFVT